MKGFTRCEQLREDLINRRNYERLGVRPVDQCHHQSVTVHSWVDVNFGPACHLEEDIQVLGEVHKVEEFDDVFPRVPAEQIEDAVLGQHSSVVGH